MTSKDCHTISMDGSKLSWKDADERAKQIGFKERSQYVQYLIERDIEHKRFENIKIREIIMFMMLALIVLMLVMVRV